MDENVKVKDFFQRRVNKFDAYYSQDKSPLWRLLDYLFRRSMRQRFIRALEEVARLKSPSVLDIGCGPGRYSVAAAKVGAVFVTGIDFSEQMLRRARQLAEESGVQEKCEFICGEFLEYRFSGSFDLALAIGLFDYLHNPADYLKKIKGLARKKIVMSFPASRHLRNIIRRVRLFLLGCPVHFYTQEKIAGLLKNSGIYNFRIEKLDRDYFVVVDIG